MVKECQLEWKYIKLKKTSNYKKTSAYLQKLRYKLPAFISVEQCRSVERIFFKNIDSFEPGYQTPKIFNAFRLRLLSKLTHYQSSLFQVKY